MQNKILFIIVSVIISVIVSLYNINSKNIFNTNNVTKLINDDSNLILYPLEKISRKKVKIINDKEFNKNILDFDKSRFPYIVLDGLFNETDGDLISDKSSKCPFYKRNKIPISDFINYKLVKSFDKINKIIEEELLLEKLNKKINISKKAFKITALIIGNVILEINDFEIIYSLENSFSKILKDLSNRPQLYSIFKFFKRTPIPKNMEILKDIENINNIFNKIIKDENNALILEMQKNNSYQEIFNFLKFIFFAGFETTSNQLSFVMYMLSQNNKWEEEIYNEIINVTDYTSLGNCKFLNSFIYETFRIHPIVNTSTRKDDDNIYIFNAKKMNQINNDDNFNPYRFIHKIPEIYTFQAGKRQCIGKRLSIVEIQLFVIHFVKLFFIKSNNNPNIEFSLTKYLSPFLELEVESKTNRKLDIIPPEINRIEQIKVNYKGESYDLSEYVFKHPGGKYIILALKNNDITEEFISKHIDSIKANKILEKYKNYQPNPDIYKLYNIDKVNYNTIGSDFVLLSVKYDKKCNLNKVFKEGNTVVFHQINGFKTRCFSISKINKNNCTFTLFIKKYNNSLFLDNIDLIPKLFKFSLISSIYSNIKSNDVLISIGSGLAPFIGFNDKCRIVGSFRGNYNLEFKSINVNNLLLSNTENKKETIYDLIDKLKINRNSNIYLCGNDNFVDQFKNKYKFKNIFYDEW